MTTSPNAYCISIPSTGFHSHCVGRDAELAFQCLVEALRGRAFKVLSSPTKCLAPHGRLHGTFTYRTDK